MRLKKIWIVATLLTFLFSSTKVLAADEMFLDNNAISNITEQSESIVISEVNTGKIISKKNDTKQLAVNNLPNYLAVYLLANDIKNKKLTLDSTIPLVASDDTLNTNEIKDNISVKDAIFFLEQNSSSAVLDSVVKYYALTLESAKELLMNLSLSNTTLADLKDSSSNLSTSRDISYLTSLTLKTYPEITEITKNPSYTLANDKKVDNNIKFIESDKFRVTGLNFVQNNSTTVAYSGNTKLTITILNQTSDKDSFFDNLQKTYSYLFDNYNYKLALKAGTYKINNENITLDNDIYDLFYTKHSIKDVTYLLMNNKILLFQKYETTSANEGTVFSEFKSESSKSSLAKIETKLLNDDNFASKDNLQKSTIVIERGRLFIAFGLAVYSLIFIVIYVLKKLARKG